MVISGAVTMKMISSTSITSMNGTMLISLIVRRRRELWAMTAGMAVHLGVSARTAGRRCADVHGGAPALRCRMLVNSSMKVSELDRDAVDVAREAVVGHHRGDGGEQADRGGHQRLGDARRHGGQRHLLQVRQADEGMHDPPHGAEQADVRADRAHRGEEAEVALDHVQLALEAGAHGAARAVEQRAGVEPRARAA